MLEGQVQIFQILLGGGQLNRLPQIGRQLSLLFNAFEHGFAPVLQLAQVAEAVFKLTQLNVIQPAGGLLAVARDERHSGAAVEEFNSGFDLVVLHLDLEGNLTDYFLH